MTEHGRDRHWTAREPRRQSRFTVLPEIEEPSMNIAQVAPVWHEVSATSPGPVEHMISVLTEELVRHGHRVTLFASGDSETAAKLIPACARRLCDVPSRRRDVTTMITMFALERAFARGAQFDVIHVHTGLTALPLMRRSRIPIVATVHVELRFPEVAQVYAEFKELCFVATSPKQVFTLPALNWRATIAPVMESHERTGSASRDAERMAAAYLQVYHRVRLLYPKTAPPSRSRHRAGHLSTARADEGLPDPPLNET